MELAVSVIGTIFIDCKGFARDKYHPDGRNLGDITFVHGGVGRNVSENLVRLKLPVSLVSSVDKTAMGEEVIAHLHKMGISTQHVTKATEGGMGMWLALINEQGDLAGSISKMPDLVHLENRIDQQGKEIAVHSSHIILELDLNETITRKALAQCREAGKPVYGIPGNMDVILKNLDILPELECFICNDFEAGKICGQDLMDSDPHEVQRRLLDHFFIDKFLSRYTVVTLGANGSIYYDATNGTCGHQEAFPTQVIDTSGAGDAFFSGTVMGLIKNMSLEESVAWGSRVASWTISSSESICLDLTGKSKDVEIPGNLD